MAIIIRMASSVALILFLLTSCAGHMPSENVYFLTFDLNGKPQKMYMEKGWLDKNMKGKTWIPAVDYNPKKQGDRI